MRRSCTVALFACLLVVALPAVAEDAEEVRVYTNADLERFGPPSPLSETSAARMERERAFVADFLERAYSRLDADRDYGLRRDAVARAEEEAERDTFIGPSYLAGFPVYRGYRVPHGKPKPKARPRHARSRVHEVRTGPIHARPPLSVVGHGAAGSRSGRDAVPRR